MFKKLKNLWSGVRGDGNGRNEQASQWTPRERKKSRGDSTAGSAADGSMGGSETTVQEVKRTSEQMCGIDPETMSKEEIRGRLAALYKRHNDASGSLNPQLRKEARTMLDAIADCRIRHVDQAE